MRVGGETILPQVTGKNDARVYHWIYLEIINKGE